MSTNWMGSHRQLVEKFIFLLNTYARKYSVVAPLGNSGLFLSPAQIQTIEYILEGEGQKMSEIAARIGVTRGTFSNTIKALEAKGYIRKLEKKGNKKDICLEVTNEGKNLYLVYSEYIYKEWFEKMFALADTMTPEDIKTLEDILEGFAEVFIKE